MSSIYLTECPRDAMQGWPQLIPTPTKVQYLNQLLKVGFDVLDCGSFVSAKAIPQMADTPQVLPQLQLHDSATKLLAIVANTRGAEEAIGYEHLTYLGFPFSISETFQQRNTNKSIAASLAQVEEIQQLCTLRGKHLVIYISMGFGNPYGDEYNAEIAIRWVEKLAQLGIGIFAMSDTVGMATPQSIQYIFHHLLPALPHLKIGAHFHSTPDTRIEKLDAAYAEGCLYYDSAIKGIGGCPMAKDDLVGNMDTETVLHWAADKGISTKINIEDWSKAVSLSAQVFV